MYTAFLLTLLLPLMQAQARQQPAAPVVKPDEMDKVSFLVGRWEGDGWIEFGPGNRQTCKVTEVVQRKVGGHALLVEGLGTAKVPGDREITVRDALGVLFYDAKVQQYRRHAFKANGQAVRSRGISIQVWGCGASNVSSGPATRSSRGLRPQ